MPIESSYLAFKQGLAPTLYDYLSYPQNRMYKACEAGVNRGVGRGDEWERREANGAETPANIFLLTKCEYFLLTKCEYFLLTKFDCYAI